MVSFSGGRTSAYMLFKMVQAFDGAIPDDIVVCFANTGKEREETLRFVHECATRFGVRVRWLEYRDDAVGFAEVGLNSASRKGEPFDAIIAKKQRLPNWQERWCTSFLKLEPMFALARWYGWEAGQYTEVIGLRDDEGHRILKGLESADKAGRKVLYPLARAKVVKSTVMDLWAKMDFDLGLQPWEGNCDFCFMKGRGIRKRLIRDGATSPNWWAEKEEQQDGWFDRRDSVVGLIQECARSPELFDDPDDYEYDVECGSHCEPDGASDAS